jgi:hypothetical protein
LLHVQKADFKAVPPYQSYLNQMFKGVAVTGETAYVPSRRNAEVNISSDDEEDDEDQDEENDAGNDTASNTTGADSPGGDTPTGYNTGADTAAGYTTGGDTTGNGTPQSSGLGLGIRF